MQFAILILLAVIASVLLYGREATLDSIHNFELLGAVLLAVTFVVAVLYWALKTIGNALVAGLVGVDELVMTPLVELVLKPFHYLWYSVVEVRYSDAARTITSKWFHRLSAFLIVVGMAASLYGLSKVIPGRIPAQPI